MFWALVSPLRHTSEPPRFEPGHPIRNIFERHGASIARHPVFTIVLTIALSVILSFPPAFLYLSSTPGPSTLAHHVWTSATPYKYPTAEPNLGLKQAWVQGSYMDALNKDVLKEALKIQEALIPNASCRSMSGRDMFSGDALHHGPADGLSEPHLPMNFQEMGYFVHSPLLYWNCSFPELESDTNILRTVNSRTSMRSSAQVGLRWGSVMAGKDIHHNELKAADALVISMFYHLNSSVGIRWDQAAEKLASDARRHGRYVVYPSNGKELNNTLYEFRYEPMPLWEKVFLSVCYAVAAIYLGVALQRLRAVKSRLGLVFTVLTQICASVLSSFTVLAIFGVPVSHIPSWIFPFVIVVIGLESMFRLINAVLATPAEQPVPNRVATALGEVGFISFVATATNLAVLIIIGAASVPAIREFCIFACVALIMDYFLHMTFFLAVLSVDVRRLELQDSLDRMNLSGNDDGEGLDMQKQESNTSMFTTFFDSFMQNGLGGSPLSSRIAGSAIMICFAIVLNMHFLDNQHPLVTIGILGRMLRNPHTIGNTPLTQPQEMPLNVARSPTSWMRLQDQLTGMELIRAVKPGAVRIIARAYNPIFFVMAGSDREHTAGKIPHINAMELDIIRDHLQAFILSVIFVVAAVTLLMNHMLLRGIPMDDVTDSRKGEGPLLTTQTLIEGHSLDVAMMTSAPCGLLVTVGFDRRIVVWKLNGTQQPWTKQVIRPACNEHILWPVLAVAVDDKGKWLAVATKSGRVSFFQLEDGSCTRTVQLDLRERIPSTFFFSPRPDEHHGPQLITLSFDGRLAETYVKSGETYEHQICDGIVVSSSHGVVIPRLSLRIVTACQRGRIFVTSKMQGGDWYTEQLSLTAPPLTSPIMEPGEPCTILPLSALGMVVSSRSCNVELVDLLTGSIIRSFQTGQFRPPTLRAFHAKRRTCLYCGCPSVTSFSIAYSERETGMFMMHTFASSRGRQRDICLRAERDRRERKCTGFESVVETIHWLENVEGWEPTNLNKVAGVRRREIASEEPSSDDFEPYATHSSSLRRRKKTEKKRQEEDDDEWEAWTMDAQGVVASYPIRDPTDRDAYDDRLMVSRIGPVTKIGQQSMAVGFGNTVKVLYVGNERFDEEDSYTAAYQSIGRKQRMHHRRH